MTTIAEYDQQYDALSRITQLAYTSLVGDSGTSDYGYDHTSQLTTADHDYQADEAFSFDENGNRTMSGYTIGANNRITSDGTFNYEFDDEGNMTVRERISSDPADDYRTELAWDHRNRLTSIVYKNNSGTVTKEINYTYDVFDRRIEKEIDWDRAGSNDPEFVRYLYDGPHIVAAFNGDNELTNRYVHNPETYDQVFADEQFLDGLEIGDTQADPGEVLWPLPDYLGSIRDIVDSTGDVVNHLVFSAFGQIVSETDPSIKHIFAYTGRERDDESHLQHNRARYYDAAIGRWASEDPIGFFASDSNLVRYVRNSPTTLTDPTGLTSEGHHWTPIAVITKLYEEKIISKAEWLYFAGRYSGPVTAQ
jgi:RHS repeat-associated protein